MQQKTSQNAEEKERIELDWDEISQLAVSILVYPRHRRATLCKDQGFISNTLQGIAFTYEQSSEDKTNVFCVKIAANNLLRGNKVIRNNHQIMTVPNAENFEREIATTQKLKGCRGENILHRHTRYDLTTPSHKTLQELLNLSTLANIPQCSI